jgi:hypothetical protein
MLMQHSAMLAAAACFTHRWHDNGKNQVGRLSRKSQASFLAVCDANGLDISIETTAENCVYHAFQPNLSSFHISQGLRLGSTVK